jgi:hypothetical protein
MADHYVSLNRGVAGEKYSDFTTGTASTAGDSIELRVKDGASLTRKDVHLALEAFERFFQNAQQFSGAGFDVNP